MGLIACTSFSFAQNRKYDTRFSKYHIELKVALSLTIAIKKIENMLENGEKSC